MRSYEAMFIFHPDLDEEKLSAEIGAIEKIVKGFEVADLKIDNMGKRTLAYLVKKQREGYYVTYQFKAAPSAMAKIKEELKHRDNVLRYVMFAKEAK